NLKLEGIGRALRFGQRALDDLDDVLVLELSGRKVYRHTHFGVGLVAPNHNLLTGLLQHPFANGQNHATVFGNGYEFIGRDSRAIGLRPAQQRLYANDLTTLCSDFWLVVQLELVVLLGATQAVGDFKPSDVL